MTIESPYKFEHLGMGVYLIDTKAFTDNRGYFMEAWNQKVFEENGIKADFNQYNVSESKKGVLRGLHFQKHPYGQAKMFRCVKGEIWDCCVDVRKGSPTFGQHVSATYSETDKKMMFVPAGFANAIIAMSDAILVYMVEGYHVSEAETGLQITDPDLDIKLPMPLEQILSSEKDKSWKPFSQLKAEMGME